MAGCARLTPFNNSPGVTSTLFEQAAITLVREMPVLAAARIIGVSDTRLWLVVQLYVA
ncbi:hypothetical protein DFAR_3170025 [Desulfarculales bacterium]